MRGVGDQASCGQGGGGQFWLIFCGCPLWMTPYLVVYFQFCESYIMLIFLHISKLS